MLAAGSAYNVVGEIGPTETELKQSELGPSPRRAMEDGVTGDEHLLMTKNLERLEVGTHKAGKEKFSKALSVAE